MSRPILVLVLACAVALAGCAAQKTDAPAGQSGAPRSATFTAADYSFDGPDALGAGWVTVTFTNAGTELHEMFVSALPEGKTYADFEAAMALDMGDDGDENDTESDEAWDALEGGHLTTGIGAVASGVTMEVTFQAAPGTYVLQCWIPAPDGTPHAFKGMHAALNVTGSAAGAMPTESDVTLTFAEGNLTIEPAFDAGVHTVKAVNANAGTGEADATGLQFIQLEGNATWMDFLAAFEPNATGPPPGTAWGGLSLLPGGQTAFFEVDLAPGRYVILSFGEEVAALAEFTVA